MAERGPSTRRLDPDRLAMLEHQRDLLLRALADLDVDHDAGEIDDLDYAALKDDYTRRAAEALRGIDSQRAVLAVTPRRSRRSGAVWLVGLALLGAVAGFAISRSSGDRDAGGTITGGIDASVSSLLNDALGLFGISERWPDAIAIYDEVLDQQPSNVEALTYRAWLRYRSGEGVEPLLDTWAEASALEPSYPDAIVFRAIALTDLERYGDAAAVLDQLPSDGLAPMIEGLLSSRGLRGEVYGEARYAQIAAASTAVLADLGVSSDVALEMANYLLSSDHDDPIVVIKLFNAVLAADPDDPAALSRKGLLLAQAAAADRRLLDDAVELLDRAVEANPDSAEALVSRATLYEALDPDVACGDLDALAALDPGGAGSEALLAQAALLRARMGCS